jgi:hypothetical protein
MVCVYVGDGKSDDDDHVMIMMVVTVVWIPEMAFAGFWEHIL